MKRIFSVCKMFCLILLVFACSDKTEIDKKSKSINNKDDSVRVFIDSSRNNIIEYKSFSNSKLSEGTAFFFDKSSGVLLRRGIFDKERFIGAINFYSEQGQLVRSAYYTTDTLRKNSLVENIEYKENGEIDYTKSLFLEVVPTPISDTIHIYKNSKIDLEITPHYWETNEIELFIYKNDVLQDTLETKNEQEVQFQLSELEKGINELKVVVHAFRAPKRYVVMKSIRFIRVY